MRVLAALAMLANLVACASAPKRTVARVEQAPAKAAEAVPVEQKVDGDELVRTYDLNGDKKPDVWRTFKLVPDPRDPAKRIEVPVRTELDTNFDGKVDVWTWFDEHGNKVKDAFDLDFDQRVDVVRHFEKGVLVRKETFHGGASTPDQVTFYEGGVKARVERDTLGKGRVDTWEHYEDGKLVRYGQDTDGDGAVDRWVVARDDDDGARAKKPTPSRKTADAKPKR